MSRLEQLKEKAKGLEAKEPKRAVEIWLEVLNNQDETNPDLSVYNRIGDLYIKLRDPGQAADYYDQAVDKYAELGFHNNAIAMCNKVLRNAPARQSTYLKLAKLYAAKGFIAEAKQNFVEYAERMHKAGRIEHAFAALKEFTDISPESANLRAMLAEQLKMYGTDPGKRGSAARVTPTPPPAAPKPAPPPGGNDVGKSGKRKSSSLVFLDLDEPRVPKGAKAPPPAAHQPPESPPVAETLIEEVVPEPDESLEIETTSLVDEAPGGGRSGGMLEGLETTVADFGQVRQETPKAPTIREELNPADLDLEPDAELEPTIPEVSADEGLELEGADLVFEGNIVDTPPAAAPPPPPAKKAGPTLKPLGRAPAGKAAPEPPRVKPVVPKRPPPAAPGKRKAVVEVPPLELEPDFESTTTKAGHDVDDEPLAIDEPPRHPSFIQTEDETSISTGGRRSGFIDLGIDEISSGGDQAGSLVFSNIEQTPAAPGIEELEERVADNPDDPEAHQALAEALVEQGERERGIEELDLAVAGYENAGNLSHARDLVDEVLRLDPNSVRHRQKAVEFAFKAGDKAKLIDAYVELADALLRSDLPEKARAVYARVADHDPTNERAKAALSMLAPAVATPAPTSGKPEGKVKAKDAKMKVRDEATVNGDYIDLGSMLSEEDEDLPAKDTRMTVADEEPTGDEEQDFQDMLARFKQGIDENIDEADFQSHYDLGVAFKEMGLLDEAIAELQKALRAPEGKLRTSEMLGICFFEKGAFGVAETILRRGLDLPASGDQERLGILYWLGRALEQQGKKADARDLYGRVFAVDIRFLDAEQRVQALAKAK
ncbi:MAG TPA: tetratricopeptide repeat protein [Gemmatimonadales bacterium]|jgi:tetratricopeptide (TPR) repeat protein